MTDGKSDRSFYRNYYREIDVLHGLQSAPEERDWLLTTPPPPPPTSASSARSRW